MAEAEASSEAFKSKTSSLSKVFLDLMAPGARLEMWWQNIKKNEDISIHTQMLEKQPKATVSS